MTSDFFVLYFSHLFVPLASPKVLSFKNKNKHIYFVFHSLIRTFGFAESTFVQK